MNIFETTAVKMSGVTQDGEIGSAVATRANIIELTQAAEDAVLRPRDFGAFDHVLRAALAARVALLAGDEALESYYLTGAGDRAVLDQTGADQWLEVILSFVDKVANETRDVAAEDILALQGAGISDADIVRLCELVAFLAYQIRVIAGLRLMKGAAA
ncbi:hypothetical protein P775_26115 [Puniceibacterium antarcticum]|uniref:Alkylhydroperoxidase n=1 Tax=Puniceibacterium antarcticum TaxID=1206336 RepID=A0A2G8R033_9RHOB|nr:hypothetical protein [Puniceibacterium antarcticum]PIL14910.1 hypothetical protein P775_26115 [Puniceibacterium antarcticum]